MQRYTNEASDGFNGAPSGWTEKATEGPTTTDGGTTLQWGSVRLDGEGPTPFMPQFAKLYALQWGSVRLDGEGKDTGMSGCAARRLQWGSVRLDGEGGRDGRELVPHAFMLQWGSVRLDGEGKPNSPTSWATAGFNGAPSGWTEKVQR